MKFCGKRAEREVKLLVKQNWKSLKRTATEQSLPLGPKIPPHSHLLQLPEPEHHPHLDFL